MLSKLSQAVVEMTHLPAKPGDKFPSAMLEWVSQDGFCSETIDDVCLQALI